MGWSTYLETHPPLRAYSALETPTAPPAGFTSQILTQTWNLSTRRLPGSTPEQSHRTMHANIRNTYPASQTWWRIASLAISIFHKNNSPRCSPPLNPLTFPRKSNSLLSAQPSFLGLARWRKISPGERSYPRNPLQVRSLVAYLAGLPPPERVE